MTANVGKPVVCSRCGGARENAKQRHCRSCHAAYMRARRRRIAANRLENVSRELAIGLLSLGA
jgi:DnaJ-class molecular chaperone